VRQFSFWLGRWDVFTPDGAHVGTNDITPLFDGRVLVEHWTGDSGVTGVSLNAWNAERGVWHQTWMDSTGSTPLARRRADRRSHGARRCIAVHYSAPHHLDADSRRR